MSKLSVYQQYGNADISKFRAPCGQCTSIKQCWLENLFLVSWVIGEVAWVDIAQPDRIFLNNTVKIHWCITMTIYYFRNKETKILYSVTKHTFFTSGKDIETKITAQSNLPIIERNLGEEAYSKTRHIVVVLFPLSTFVVHLQRVTNLSCYRFQSVHNIDLWLICRSAIFEISEGLRWSIVGLILDLNTITITTYHFLVTFRNIWHGIPLCVQDKFWYRNINIRNWQRFFSESILRGLVYTYHKEIEQISSSSAIVLLEVG